MLSCFITSQNCILPDKTDDKFYILEEYLCYACYRDKVYTGLALDTEGFITIGDIIIGLAWWVPYIVRNNYDF